MKHFMFLLFFTLFTARLQAQEDKTPWVKLTLEPAAAPVPALKYQLLPEVRDLKPGNAALLYQRAHAPEAINAFLRHPDYSKFTDWLDLPMDKLPVSKARSLLPASLLKEVDRAARQEYCNWEMLSRVREEGMGLLLADVQGMRYYANLLALRVRLEMVEKKYGQAVYSLQTGYALSRHLNEQPVLISSLVGLAIAGVMSTEVENLIQQAGAPNLYWALADLPRPLLDLRKPLQGDKLFLEGLLPEIRQALNDPTQPPLAPAQIGAIVDRLATMMGQQGKGPNLPGRFQAGVTAALIYKEARQYLLDHGYPSGRLEALPITQVALMFSLAEYDQVYDDLLKWQNLPYDRALAGMRAAEEQCAKLRARRPPESSLAASLIPGAVRIKLAQLRLDRRLAALGVVEALRLHAAAHQGKLPASLDDIRAVPIPLDPLTGKAFDYRLEGERARLSGLAPPGEAAQSHNVIRYEITLRKK